MKRRYSLIKTLIIFLTALVLGAVSLIAFNWLKAHPATVTEVYRPFSRSVLGAMSGFWSFVPFSAAEVLLYALILGAVCFLVRLIWVLISGDAPRLKYLLRKISVLLLIAVVAVSSYYALWGMNYFGLTLGTELGLDVKKRSSAELCELAEYLCERTNELSLLVERDGTGAFSPEYTFEYFADEVAREFSEYSGREEKPAKYVIWSSGLSEFRTTGIFVAYTGEANVNRDNYVSSLPFCMAHETAHRYAVAREDEANFMAFLVLWDAEDPALAYSVHLAALRYTQSQLSSADREAFLEVSRKYNDLVRYDNQKYSEYWSQFEGKAAEVSQKTNNAYLSVNGQSDGTRSYGRMVDLLLAWYGERD